MRENLIYKAKCAFNYAKSNPLKATTICVIALAMLVLLILLVWHYIGYIIIVGFGIYCLCDWIKSKQLPQAPPLTQYDIENILWECVFQAMVERHTELGVIRPLERKELNPVHNRVDGRYYFYATKANPSQPYTDDELRTARFLIQQYVRASGASYNCVFTVARILDAGGELEVVVTFGNTQPTQRKNTAPSTPTADGDF
jgi:hypothetical protein